MSAPAAAAGSWWRDAVIYQVYVPSFADSDGDGVGDLPGVTAGLPYLVELGVDGIWLSPFYRSPQKDGGYDVADHCDVDPRYGTVADFDALVARAHELGLKVVLDVVPNHCSTEHPLFEAALADGPGSAARELFHFADGRDGGNAPPNNWRSMFGGPAWEQVADGQWFLHLFSPAQPDLNWRHPSTRPRFEQILRFWLDRGVDGFRVDAAQGLFKHPDLPDADDPDEEERQADAVNVLAWNQPEVHDVYRSWRKLCDEYAARDGSDRVLIGEITGAFRSRLSDYVHPAEMHQGFFFDLLESPYGSDQFGSAVRDGLAAATADGSTVTWVLGNHDRTRIATRYGSARRARAATLLTLALPGAAYLFQGDELGLREVRNIPAHRRTDPIFARTDGAVLGRDGCRVPLPWSGRQAPFGFSSTPDTWLPQPDIFAEHTVAAQQADPASMWRLCQDALRLRRAHLTGDESVQWIKSPPGVIAFTRGTGFTCVANLTDSPILTPSQTRPTLLSSTGHTHVIPPDTTVWWITAREDNDVQNPAFLPHSENADRRHAGGPAELRPAGRAGLGASR